MPVEIAAIVFGLTEILLKIVQRANAVRRFKGKVAKLAGKATRLSNILEQNATTVIDLDTYNSLHACAQNCLTFVEECTRQWSILEVSFEVIFRHRYQSLQSELDEWILLFMIESGIKPSGMSASRAIDDESQSREEMHKEISFLHEELKAIRKTLVPGSADLEKMIPHYSEYDTRLSLQYNDTTGTINGKLDGFGEIECHKLDSDVLGLSLRLSKQVRIYHRLSAKVCVQRLYGILKREKVQLKYSIMEDLSNCMTLNKAIELDALPQDMLIRLRIAYEIASTMAYLHRVGILLKCLSDNVVRLKPHQGMLRPVITDLHSARLFLELSDSVEYDVRYEAPEYKAQNLHTVYTDVWSLGVIIWQCLVGKFPFGISIQGEQEDIDRDVNDGTVRDDCANLLTSCSRYTPTLRPPAGFLAQQLLDILTLTGASISSQSDNVGPSTQCDDLEELKRRCWEAIENTRNRTASQNIIKSSDFSTLLESNRSKFDPVISLLLGAMIWRDIVEWDSWNDEFTEAYDIPPKEKRAHRALRFLRCAAECGDQEACREVSKVYAYLADSYRQKYEEGIDMAEN